MSNKLYVGNLSWDTNDQSLRQAFEVFGEVSDAVVISDRETGRSRGFGFVTLEDSDAASDAISKLDGTALDGRNIKVNQAQDKPRRNGGGGGYGGGGGGGGDRW